MDLLIETTKLVDDLAVPVPVRLPPRSRQAPSWRLKQWFEAE